MKDVSYDWAALPSRKQDVALRDLPWMRRERVDMNIRAAIGDLRALSVEDGQWFPQYRALADAFEAAIKLIDAIEDFVSESEQFSLRVDS